ncbi:MAG: hypothetical protein ABIL74_00385 [candidate division WOR-3 bacterium]
MILFFIFLQNELLRPEKIREFADYLYLQGNYDAAVQEYRRYLFMGSCNPQEIAEKIVDCLVRMKKYDEALASLKHFTDTTKTLYTKSWIHLLKGDYPVVRELLKDRAGEECAKYYIGLSYVGEFNFQKAREFIELPTPAPKLKNHLLGGLFSFIPGGGHFYCGRIGDGLYSLLVIGTGVGISYYYYHNHEKTKFYLAAGITVVFYAGNIYGGINAVRNYNYYLNARYRDLIFGCE